MDWDDIPEVFQSIIFLGVLIIFVWITNFVSNVGQFFGDNPIYLWSIIGIMSLIIGIKYIAPIALELMEPTPKAIIKKLHHPLEM